MEENNDIWENDVPKINLNPTIEDRFYAVRDQMMKDAYQWIKICYPGIKGSPNKKGGKQHKFIPCHYGRFGPEPIRAPVYTGWEKIGDYLYSSQKVYPDGICDESYYSFVISETNELRLVDEPTKNTYPIFKITDIKSPAKRIIFLKAIAQTLIDDPENIAAYLPDTNKFIKCSEMITA